MAYVEELKEVDTENIAPMTGGTICATSIAKTSRIYSTTAAKARPIFQIRKTVF